MYTVFETRERLVRDEEQGLRRVKWVTATARYSLISALKPEQALTLDP
jgi:hypothetical protein